MGKRKRATKPPPKKKTAKLDKIFDCPFCGHEQCVDCYIERESNIGRVECRVCGAKYSSIIHHLEEEIDVYAKWIDACDQANNRDKQPEADPSAPQEEEEDDVGPRESIRDVAELADED